MDYTANGNLALPSDRFEGRCTIGTSCTARVRPRRMYLPVVKDSLQQATSPLSDVGEEVHRRLALDLIYIP